MNKFSNKKKIILGSIIGILIGTLVSTSYAFFTYTRTGSSNNQLVTGNIWMRYGETKELKLENAMPSDTYDSSQKFEFTIDGANTTTDKDIWYEIKIKHGTIPTGTPTRSKDDRIPDRFIKYKLVKEENNVEEVLVDGDSWEGLDTGKIIHVDKIEKNKQTVNHKYTLYMWISNKLEIGNSQTANFSIENWKKAFASIKVDVNGDFTEKVVDEPIQTVNAMNTFPTIITDQKANIKEVYFKKMSASAMQTAYDNAEIKADLTYNNEGKVLAWLEHDTVDNTKYIMYVASDGETYLTTGKTLFVVWNNMEKIEFNNINTSRVTDMTAMFLRCSNLQSLNLSNFDTSNVTNMSAMFNGCNSLISLNLNGLGSNALNNMSGIFSGCEKLQEINMRNFNFGQVTTLFIDNKGLFENLQNLENLDISNSGSDNLTSVQDLLYGCTNLKTLNMSNFNFGQVTTLHYNSSSALHKDDRGLFSNLINLENINLTNINTTKINSMWKLFQNCEKLTTLDLSSFDTSGLVESGCAWMFENCTLLQKIYVDPNKWNMTNQSNGMPIFGGNTNLVGLAPNGTTYTFDSSKVDKNMAVVATNTTEGYLTDISLKPNN